MPYLPLLRRMAAVMGKTEPLLRSALALEIFAERGLIELQHRGRDVVLCRHIWKEKVELENCILLRRLHDYANGRCDGHDGGC